MLSGLFGGKAADKAAKAQAASQQAVINETAGAVKNAQGGVTAATTAGLGDIAGGVTNANATLSPLIAGGTGALNSLNNLATGTALNTPFSFTQKDLTNNPANPGYQFTLSEGEKAIQKAAAAQGGLFSTGTLKSLTGYAEGTASQYEQQAYNQSLQNFQTNQQQALNRGGIYQNILGFGAGATGQSAAETLQGGEAAAGLGLQGATTSGGYGLKGSEIIGNALSNQGNAQAAGTVGSTNAWLNALQGGSNAITGYLTNRSLYGNNTLGTGSVPVGGYLPPSSSTPVPGPINPITGQPM